MKIKLLVIALIFLINVGFDFTCYMSDNPDDSATARVVFSVGGLTGDPVTISFDSVENATLEYGSPAPTWTDVRDTPPPSYEYYLGFDSDPGYVHPAGSDYAYKLYIDQGETAILRLSATDVDFNDDNLFIGLIANLATEVAKRRLDALNPYGDELQ